MADDVYRALADHLDEFVVGFPTSPAAIAILKVLFPGEEAEVGLALSFEPRTLEQWRQAMPEKADRLAGLLESMASRGTVYSEQRPGRERVYRLLPSIVGFSETPFFSGRETDATRELAPLWLQYFKEKYGEELERGVPLVRVIPVSEALEDSSEVLPYDALRDKVLSSTYAAVASCPCRQMWRLNGQGCSHSLGNCLHFGSMARYMVERGMARHITGQEALDIIKAATDEGLVHVCDNIQGVLTTVCNCCSCCCAFLTTMRWGRDSLARSNYVAAPSADDCVGCSACSERCPVGAVSQGTGGVAEVREELCIGCGVCVPTCATGTMALGRRPREEAPPDPGQFVTARLKGQ